MSFNLTSVIRQTLGSTATADPHVIAKQVVADLPESAMADCLLQLLPHAITREAAALREGNSRLGRACGTSSRRRGIDPGERFLAQLAPFDLCKFVRECDKTDCETIAEKYAEQGKANTAKGRRWAKLAKKLEPGQTVADLPAGEAAGAILG